MKTDYQMKQYIDPLIRPPTFRKLAPSSHLKIATFSYILLFKD